MHVWLPPSQISPVPHWLSELHDVVQMPFEPHTWPVGQGLDELHCGFDGSGVHAPLSHVKPVAQGCVALQPGTHAPLSQTFPLPHS